MDELETIRRPRRSTPAGPTFPPGLLQLFPLGDPPRLRFFALPEGLTVLGRGEAAHLRLDDPEVSRRHAVIERRGARVQLADAGSENGVAVGGEEIERVVLGGGEILRIGGHLFRYLAEGTAPASTEHPLPPGPMITGPRLAALRAQLERAAQVELSLLVEGETGTGKELAARFVHAEGPRRAGPFVAINCAAIPAELVESELFGHARGAFTGAAGDRPGVLREAHGGMLFLDELGELPPSAQAKLLRAVEERRVRPVGGSGDVPVDLRIVSATNRALADEVAAGRFRRDLWARLAQLSVRLPPLAEHVEDLPALAAHFLVGTGKVLSADAVERLVLHPWPGNIRALRVAIDRAVFAAGDAVTLEPEHFELEPIAAPPVAEAPAPSSEAAAALAGALAAHDGDVARAAAALGISRSQLYRRAQKLGVKLSDLHPPRRG